MRQIRWHFILWAFLSFVCGASAVADEYADPSGFSFTYPEDWFPVTADVVHEGSSALPAEMKSWIAKNNIDLSRVKVVLIRRGHDEFLENMNVVVSTPEIPVSTRTLKKLTDHLTRQYAAMGVHVDKLQTRVQQVGKRDAFVAEYEVSMPGIPFPLRQKQVTVPGGGKTYIVTCTGRAASYDRYSPTFEAVLASFRSPPAAAWPIDWRHVFRMSLLGGIIGAVAGGLIFTFKKLSARNKAAEKCDGSTMIDRH